MSDSEPPSTIGAWLNLSSLGATNALWPRPPDSIFRQIEAGHLKPIGNSTSELLRSAVRVAEHSSRFTELASRSGLLSSTVAETLRRSAIYDSLKPSPAMQSILDAGARYRALFNSPAASQIFQLTQIGAKSSALVKLAYGSEFESIARKLGAMQHPWMQVQHGLISVKAFADIQAIGELTRLDNPFDKIVGTTLRKSLGDWRDTLTFTSSLADPSPRLALYLNRGFDSALTDFPVESFDETIEAAGLLHSDDTIQIDTDEDGLVRNVRAFDILQRFEVKMRTFIAAILASRHGQAWIKQRIPGNLREAWEGRRAQAIAAGEGALDLIHYADFSDYKSIIERNDNWQDAFASVFVRKEDVRESLQRLGPLRIAVAHARLLTAEDLMLLTVETRRILRRIEPHII